MLSINKDFQLAFFVQYFRMYVSMNANKLFVLTVLST